MRPHYLLIVLILSSVACKKHPSQTFRFAEDNVALASGATLSAPPVEPQDHMSEPALIKSVINGYKGEVKDCYEVALATQPELQGRLEVLWYITDGVVTEASVLGNTTGDDGLGACLIERIKAWTFPPQLEAETEVMYPFIFSPK